MRKLLLTLSAAVLFGLTVNAQTDTTGTTKRKSTSTQSTKSKTGSDYNKSGSSTTGSGTSGTTSGTTSGSSGTYGSGTTSGGAYDTTGTGSSGSRWRTEDQETVTRENLPAQLIQTLSSDEYKGWENATIYRNRSTNGYMLIISDGASSTPRTLYFDSNGQPIKENSGTMGSGSSDSGSMQSGSSGSGSYDTTGTGSMNRNSGSSSTSGSTSGSTTGGTAQYGDTNSSSGTVGASSGQSGSSTQTRKKTSGSKSDTKSGSGTSGSGSSGSGSSSTSGSGSTAYSSDGSTMSSGSTTDQPSSRWKADDLEKIDRDDVPTSLRAALQDTKYSGWESADIYRNKTTNEYVVMMKSGSDKAFYFDKDGNAISASGMKTDDQ